MDKKDRIEYVTNLCKEKNFSEAQTKRALEIASADEGDAQLLGELIDLPLGRQATFSKEMNGLKAKHTQLDEWHRGAKTAFDANNSVKSDLEKKIQLYEGKFGKLDAAVPQGDGTVVTPSGHVLDEKKVTELLNDRDQSNLRLLIDQNKIIAEHAKMFKGEIIDASELLMDVAKAANEPNPRHISLGDAYKVRFGERVAAEQTRIATERDQKLRDEGAAAERKRATAAQKSGANVGERSTALFTAIASESKKDDPSRQKTEDERIDDFATDLENEFQKVEQAATT